MSRESRRSTTDSPCETSCACNDLQRARSIVCSVRMVTFRFGRMRVKVVTSQPRGIVEWTVGALEAQGTVFVPENSPLTRECLTFGI